MHPFLVKQEQLRLTGLRNLSYEIGKGDYSGDNFSMLLSQSFRLEAYKNQTVFAKRAGVTTGTVTRWLQGVGPENYQRGSLMFKVEQDVDKEIGFLEKTLSRYRV